MIWVLSVGPKEFRDPADAVKIAEQLSKEHPADNLVLEACGLALYRAGDFTNALSRLETAAKVQGRNPYPATLLLLAVSHLQSGRGENAGECYERAASALEVQTGIDRLLQDLFTEAAELFPARQSPGSVPYSPR